MKGPIRASYPVRRRARELRRESTPAEDLLWSRLRGRQLAGLKFRRQHPLGRCIADFYCAKYRLVVEIDGGIHEAQREYDEVRTEYLEGRGRCVIRFRNEHVLNDVEGVLAAIESVCSGLADAEERDEEGDADG